QRAARGRGRRARGALDPAGLAPRAHRVGQDRRRGGPVSEAAAFAWPASRVGEALGSLGLRAGFSAQRGAFRPLASGTPADDDPPIGRYLQTAGASLGMDVDETL